MEKELLNHLIDVVDENINGKISIVQDGQILSFEQLANIRATIEVIDLILK